MELLINGSREPITLGEGSSRTFGRADYSPHGSHNAGNISRQQFCLTLRGTDLFVCSLSSTNPTKVLRNGGRATLLAQGQEARLGPGDSVLLHLLDRTQQVVIGRAVGGPAASEVQQGLAPQPMQPRQLGQAGQQEANAVPPAVKAGHSHQQQPALQVLERKADQPEPGGAADPSQLGARRRLGLAGEAHASPCRLLTWNVNAILKKLQDDTINLGALAALHSLDVICLQETKLTEDRVEAAQAAVARQLPGWHSTWHCCTLADKKGYAGTAILSRRPPLAVSRGMAGTRGGADDEGRVLTAEFGDFVLVNAYVVFSGPQLQRLEYRLEWDQAFAAHVRQQAQRKPVIVTGDLNVTHREADVHPGAPTMWPCKTREERASFEAHLLGQGLDDAYRKLHPGEPGYTYWGWPDQGGAELLRREGKGWRLDYALVSRQLLGAVRECRPLQEVKGSDHCPVLLALGPGGGEAV